MKLIDGMIDKIKQMKLEQHKHELQRKVTKTIRNIEVDSQYLLDSAHFSDAIELLLDCIHYNCMTEVKLLGKELREFMHL